MTSGGTRDATLGTSRDLALARVRPPVADERAFPASAWERAAAFMVTRSHPVPLAR